MIPYKAQVDHVQGFGVAPSCLIATWPFAHSWAQLNVQQWSQESSIG